MFDAAYKLWETNAGNAGDEPKIEDDIQAQASALYLLRRKVSRIPLTPVCLGSGRASAKHKMKALMWSLVLESGPEIAATILSLTEPMLTDQGAESSLSCFGKFSLVDFFPWLLETDDGVDADMAQAAADFNFDWRADVGLVAPVDVDLQAPVGVASADFDLHWGEDVGAPVDVDSQALH